MGYHHLDPADVDPLSDRPVDARSFSDAAQLDNLGLRLYRAQPGQQLPLTYHSHDRQEEAFYVVDGTLHVETPDRDYEVGTGEVFVAEPGQPHRAHNPEDADASVRVLAVGAPAVDDARPYEPS
jgi:quercetin dioxygenase-like cupin family protein